jgi:hypothetical protein
MFYRVVAGGAPVAPALAVSGDGRLRVWGAIDPIGVVVTIPDLVGMTISLSATSLVPGPATATVTASGQVTSAELVIDSLDISEAEGGGGGRVVMTGTFPRATPIAVYVGPTGTSSDTKAHSGKPGVPSPYSYDGETLTFYLPVLEPGTYNVFADDGVHSDVIPNVITVVKSNFRTGVFSLRNALSPMFFVGPRSVDRMP